MTAAPRPEACARHADPTPRLVIDRDALARNLATLRKAAGAAETAAVVKADAYGLGAGAIVPRLHAEGCRSFFTATAREGAAVRSALGERPAAIYVLHGYWEAERALLGAAGLTPVLNTPEQISAWRRDADGAPCALHLDTGMNRLGLSAEDARALLNTGGGLTDLGCTLVMSHLACADDPDAEMNSRQRAAFVSLTAGLRDVRLSLANTGGVLLGEAFAFDLVRPGIGLYGGDPAGRSPGRFEPVVRVEAPILQTRTLSPGETIGYGATFTASRAMTTATVALGYADGFLRASGPGTRARIAGRPAPIVGRVSMDLIVLDVTDLETAVAQGAPAVFFGADLEATAGAGGTLGYELLTRLGGRFERAYEGHA